MYMFWTVTFLFQHKIKKSLLTWWHDVMPMTWTCHDKMSFLLGIILLNMGNPPQVHVKTWLLKNSSMFETVPFLWKSNIFDGKYVILKAGQCWLFTYATCTAVCFVPRRMNFTSGDGVCRMCKSVGSTKLRFGEILFHAFVDYYVNSVILSKSAENT